MFFFRSILTWPCQNTIFPTCSTYFDLLGTQIPPKLEAIWEPSGSNLGEEAKGGSGRKNVSKPISFSVFSCATECLSREFEGDPHEVL